MNALSTYSSLLVALVCAGACGRPAHLVTPTSPAAPQAEQAPVAPEPPAAPSALSYGNVTRQVVKGETTQTELIELFGGPNVASTDAEGTEVWVYERSSTETTSERHESTRADVSADTSFRAFAGFFGHQLGSARGEASSEGATSTRTSVRTLTIIIKFDAQKRVASYAARAANF